MTDNKAIPHTPRKRFGQNFLHDKTVIQRIISAINPTTTDHLIEIGPGLGALTTQILPITKNLTVIELDRDLVPYLEQHCATRGNLQIHQADALRFDYSQLTSTPRSLRIVGNLPYNISTPLLFHLLSYAPLIKDMFFMLQKEVVDRLAATPGDKAYGRLSVMAQYYCMITPLFTVSPGAFTPAPKVDSAVVQLVPHAHLPITANDFSIFSEVVRRAFNQRRKTLRNSLKGLITEQIFAKLAIDPTKRPEELSLKEFVQLSNFTN